MVTFKISVLGCQDDKGDQVTGAMMVNLHCQSTWSISTVGTHFRKCLSMRVFQESFN